MARLLLRYRWLLAALALSAAVAPATGCKSVLTTVMYLVKGTNIPAEFKELRGKRVAVVCQPLVALQYRNSTAAKDLGRQIASLLKQKVPKIEVIDQRKVDEWIDVHDWDDCREIGDALEADMVVSVEMEGFSIYQGQTLYRGKANVTLKVVDCANGGEVVFERFPPQVVYPPNRDVPVQERQESQFRREFIGILADQIARYFYAHDAYQDFALDAASL